ncbi:MAG: SidE phosphodiesterase domain-containing protein [Coxiellaceae bacterium]|nr:SidE phosphodiesterase domain-containing protein [Coxiellaceae bacterium]
MSREKKGAAAGVGSGISIADINHCDKDHPSALYRAAELNQLGVVKLLLAQGASQSIDVDAEHCALTVAIKYGHEAIAAELLANQSYLHTIMSLPLQQGPSKKNLALRRVEYILHCLLKVDYIPERQDAAEFEARDDATGEPFAFHLAKDVNNKVMAYCPNGRCYNLSLALKHANLRYFYLDESEQSKAIIARCEKKIGAINVRSASLIMSRVQSDMKHLMYAVEIFSIKKYTLVGGYEEVNSLLRDMPVYNTLTKVEDMFVQCMLAISGVNKNINFTEMDSRSKLTRHEGELPLDVISRMKTANQIVSRTGLLSFSENEVFGRLVNKTIIQDANQCQASIAQISTYSEEQEVLFPPAHLKINAYEGATNKKNHVFFASIVHGVATEYVEEYFIELALNDAYAILCCPYVDLTDPRFGIPRHNHALAHHVRACIMVDPVINYFKQHAAAEEFKRFCDHLMPDDIVMMKIMMIFSKTGRQSEASPTPSEIKTYMKYQQASAENFSRFLREEMSASEETVTFYAEIMLHMGNPNYPALVTGTEQQKRHKLYINHITALSHKMDLPRVYGRSQYDRAMSGYNGSPTHDDKDCYFISPSEKQKRALARLENISMAMLAATGDNLCFSGHGVDDFSYNEEQFILCNTKIDSCWQHCQSAYMGVLQKDDENQLLTKEFKQAIDANQIDQVIFFMFRVQPEGRSKFEAKFGVPPLLALAQSEHDYSMVLRSYCKLMRIDSKQALSLFGISLARHNAGLAMFFSDFIAAADVKEASVYLLTDNFDQAIFNKLLPRVVNINDAEHGDSLLMTAIKQASQLTAVEALIDSGAKPSMQDILLAIDKELDQVIIELLLEGVDLRLIPADFKLRLLTPELPIFVIEAVNRRLGCGYDVISLMREVLSAPFSEKHIQTAVTTLKHHSLQSDEILGVLREYPEVLTHHFFCRRTFMYCAVTQGLPIDLLLKLCEAGAWCDVWLLSRLIGKDIDNEIIFSLLPFVDHTEIDSAFVIKLVELCPEAEQINMLSKLLAGGVDVNVSNGEGNRTLLWRSLGVMSKEFIVALLNHGALVSHKDLMIAISDGVDDDIMRLLLGRAELTLIMPHFVYAFCQNTEKNNSFYSLDTILAKGYELNKRDITGHSLLDFYIGGGADETVIGELISRGADVSKDALLVACDDYNESNKEVLVMLLDAASEDKITVKLILDMLFELPSPDNLSLLDRLLAKGLDMNKLSRHEKPLLYYLIFRNHPHEIIKQLSERVEIIEQLLERGMLVTAETLSSALNSYVMQRDHTAILRLLVSRIEADQLTAELLVEILGWLPLAEMERRMSAFINEGLDINTLPGTCSVIRMALRLRASFDSIKLLLCHGAEVNPDDVAYAAEFVWHRAFKPGVDVFLLNKVDSEKFTFDHIATIVMFTSQLSVQSQLLSLGVAKPKLGELFTLFIKKLTVRPDLECNILSALRVVIKNSPDVLGGDIPRDAGEHLPVLRYAIKNDLDALTDLLLDEGADPNTPDQFGNTAFTDAIFVGNRDLTSRLIEITDPALLSDENQMGVSLLMLLLKNADWGGIAMQAVTCCAIEQLSVSHFSAIVLASPLKHAVDVLSARLADYLLANKLHSPTLLEDLRSIEGVLVKGFGDNVQLLFLDKLASSGGVVPRDAQLFMAEKCDITRVSVDRLIMLSDSSLHKETITVLTKRVVLSLTKKHGDNTADLVVELKKIVTSLSDVLPLNRRLDLTQRIASLQGGAKPLIDRDCIPVSRLVNQSVLSKAKPDDFVGVEEAKAGSSSPRL